MPRKTKGQIDLGQLGDDRRERLKQRAPDEEGGPTKAQMIAFVLDQPDMKFVDWQALMGEGVVIGLHIRRVRFRRRLQFADLGIHFADAQTERKMHEIFRLGMKNLLTKGYLDRIEQIEYRARKLLVQMSYDTIWGFFVPVTAYGLFRELLEKHEEAYYAVRDEIIANYPAIKKQVLTDYVLAARSAYRILHQLDPDALTERERQQELVYLAAVRHRVRKMLPTADDIKKSFAFEIDQTYIDLPSLAGEDDGGQGGGTRTIQDVTEEEQRELRWRQWGTKDRQTMLQMMNEEVVRDARQQKEARIDAFFTKVASQLRGLLYEATTNVLAAIRKHETLPPRSVVQLKNLVENLQLLNFYEDKDVERAMKLIENLIDRDRSDRDLILIEQRLGEIALVMRSTLLPLEYEFREEREGDEEQVAEMEEKRELAGIPRKPSRAEVREARMSLGWKIPAWDEIREERMEEEGLTLSVVGQDREERSW